MHWLWRIELGARLTRASIISWLCIVYQARIDVGQNEIIISLLFLLLHNFFDYMRIFLFYLFKLLESFHGSPVPGDVSMWAIADRGVGEVRVHVPWRLKELISIIPRTSSCPFVEADHIVIHTRLVAHLMLISCISSLSKSCIKVKDKIIWMLHAHCHRRRRHLLTIDEIIRRS